MVFYFDAWFVFLVLVLIYSFNNTTIYRKQLTLDVTKIMVIVLSYYQPIPSLTSYSLSQYPLPELVVIHQDQESLDDVLSLETYIKQVPTELLRLSEMKNIFSKFDFCNESWSIRIRSIRNRSTLLDKDEIFINYVTNVAQSNTLHLVLSWSPLVRCLTSEPQRESWRAWLYTRFICDTCLPCVRYSSLL